MGASSSVKVQIGTAPNHNQHNSLAKAFNSRISSGLGDCAWRIFYYAYSTFRNLRNPVDTNYAPQDEWFKFYGYIEPKMSYNNFSWPEAPAGSPAGINVANPFMAWIFGNASRVREPNGTKDLTYDQIHGYWSETSRLDGLILKFPSGGGVRMPENEYGSASLNIVWFDAERQRGCASFVPKFKYIRFTPQKQPETLIKEMKLLSVGVVAAARKHLRFAMESGSAGRYAPSFVPDVNGKGGIFRKKNAATDQIGQAIFSYLSYFRGTEDQRAKHNLNGKDVVSDGFNFEDFFSKQFLLAPNYALPIYERKPNGDFKTDDLGNFEIKYDDFGYPQLMPESPTFFWKYNISTIRNREYNQIRTIDDGMSNLFSFKSSKNDLQFDTSPVPTVDLNRFCLSAIMIQSSDFAGQQEGSQNFLINGLVIDMYLNNTLYETIPILSHFKYKVNRRTGLVNNANTSNVNQYYIYQFNKIHYFRYPVKGRVSFKVRATEGASGNQHGFVRLGLAIEGSPEGTDKKYAIKEIKDFRISIKFAHVLEMKPSAADAYVLLRIATADRREEKKGDMAVCGHFDSSASKKIFVNYQRFGIGYSLYGKDLGVAEVHVSANPVYESLRKFVSSHIKMADRATLVDYAVENGVSVLYFRRFAYGMKKTGIDIFRGLGPSITPVGDRNIRGSKTEVFIPIMSGKEYIVLSTGGKGAVRYMGASLNVGTKFRGANCHYVSYAPPGVGVYEIEGIIHAGAISHSVQKPIIVNKIAQTSPGTISNEWSMFMSYNLYHWADSSAWKPDMYGDIMGALNARCLTNSSALSNSGLDRASTGTSKNVKLHLANVNSARQYDVPLVVEAPSAYNYIEGANASTNHKTLLEAEDFAKSCPIYKKPYRVASVKRCVDDEAECNVVKVTLDGRLSGEFALEGRVSLHLEKCFKLLQKEKSRSDENAVVAYLCHRLYKKQCKREVIGDVSFDNQGFWKAHGPWGCCYPRFYFVKLIPLVSAGSVMYSDHYRQMEYYLRAMCNGFTNPNTQMSSGAVEKMIKDGDAGSENVGGYDSEIGDYLFEHLMMQTSNNSGANRMPIGM